MAKAKEDTSACVVCGTRAKHMLRDRSFNLRSVCFDHCPCHGDNAIGKEDSWEVWVGKIRAVPQKHMDIATKAAREGAPTPREVTEQQALDAVAQPVKRKGGRPRKQQPTV